MSTSDPDLERLEAHASARRRRIAIVLAIAAAVLVLIGALHATGVLPPD